MKILDKFFDALVGLFQSKEIVELGKLYAALDDVPAQSLFDLIHESVELYPTYVSAELSDESDTYEPSDFLDEVTNRFFNRFRSYSIGPDIELTVSRNHMKNDIWKDDKIRIGECLIDNYDVYIEPGNSLIHIVSDGPLETTSSIYHLLVQSNPEISVEKVLEQISAGDE